VRLAYGAQLSALGMPANVALPGTTAWATQDALARLGLPDGAGSVTTQRGDDYTVAGSIELPSWLSTLEPALIVPQPDGARGDIAILVVIAERPDLVAPVAAVIQSVLGVNDPSMVTIETSEKIAELRMLVQGQLGEFGRGLVALILGISGLLVAMVMTGLVIIRRKDFGRRRALGATRGLIMSIVLVQTVGLASVGAVIGAVSASVALAISGDPLPGASFTVGVCVLAVIVSGFAALAPAIVASRRDPIRELRVP
jgi:putative ABC transport system permease protein